MCLQVTIRTYGKIRPLVTSGGSRLLQNPTSLIQPIKIKMEPQRSLIQKNPTASKLPRSPTKKLGSRRIHGNR